MLRMYILVLFLVLRKGSSFTIKYASYGIFVDISFYWIKKVTFYSQFFKSFFLNICIMNGC